MCGGKSGALEYGKVEFGGLGGYSEKLSQIILQMVEKEPEKRPTASEILQFEWDMSRDFSQFTKIQMPDKL